MVGGNDTLVGGGGVDTFRFADSAVVVGLFETTRIADFDSALGEMLDLSAIDAVIGNGGNDAFSFIGTAAFTGVSGQLRWEDTGSQRLIQGDINGDSTADLTILTGGIGPVTAGWFIL